MRRAAFAVLLLTLVLAPPAVAHGGGEGEVTHLDTRQELADVNVAAVAREAQRAAAPGVAADEEGLSRTWSCTERSTDDTTDAKFAEASPQIHVVYAYASDQTSDFGTWKNRLQGDVSVVQRFLASQSGGLRALRFDMGTSCSPDEVDVTSVQLPGTRAEYLDDFDLVADDTWAALDAGGFPAERNVLILADDLTANAGYWVGQGELYNDSRHGPANLHNGGGFTSILWAPAGAPQDAGGSGLWWPEGFLHEITHNLGGVQGNAPHHTLYGHCFDESDVMCYDDGSGIAMQDSCPSISGAIDETYDCGRDDYFNPAPAPGSYLATNWNVYDNAFMASCASVAPACGGAGIRTPTPPVNTIPPPILGTPRVGQPLAAGQGSWLNAPTVYAYRWQRETAFGWSQIAGATDTVYVPTAADLGLRVRVTVTATNADGTVVAASAASAAVGGGTATSDPAQTPIAPPGPPATTARELTTAGAWLTAGKGGKRLARVAFAAPSAGVVTTRTLRLKRPSGGYAVQLCATPAAGETALATCTLKRVRARRGRLTLPALKLHAGAGRRVRVRLTLRSLTRRATATTRGTVLLDL